MPTPLIAVHFILPLVFWPFPPPDIHMNVVGTHVAQRTAELAMEGEYTTARLAALTNQRLLARSR